MKAKQVLCPFSQDHTLPFLTLLNRGRQEAGCRRYIWDGWQGIEARTGVPVLPPWFLQCSYHVMPWDGDPWEHAAPCSADRTASDSTQTDARSISQTVWTSGPFPLWDTACRGKPFQKLHSLFFKQTKSHNSGRQAACFLYRSRCTVACSGIFPHWREQAQEAGCSAFLVKDLPQPWPF